MASREDIFDWAHYSDEAEAVRRLRGLGADRALISTLGCDEAGLSIFYWPVYYNRALIVRELVEAGASLACEVEGFSRQRAGDENSSLHEAAHQRNIEVTKLLLGAGGKPLVACFDCRQDTPLHIAAGHGDLALVKLLLSAGANPNANLEEKIGGTPLDAAVGAKSVDVVRWLLGAGADPWLQTWMQMCAVDRARRLGKVGEEMLELFRKKSGMNEREWGKVLAGTEKGRGKKGR